MNCIIPILNINIDDCVGDTAGKHNYNALLLDTLICNLSSSLFNESNNISSIFDEISSVTRDLNDLNSIYTESKVNEIISNSVITTTLSSFWNKHEFSIQYPINASIFYGDEIVDLVATNNIIDNVCQESTVNIIKINNTQGIVFDNILPRLKAISLSKLNEEYNPNFTNLYTEGTIVNVIIEIFNYTPNPSDPNHLILNQTTPNVFNYNDRFITSTFTRDNVRVLVNAVLKFQLKNKKWIYIQTLNDKCFGVYI